MTYDAGTSKGVYLLEAKQALAQQAALIAGYQQLAKAAALPIPAVALPTPAVQAPIAFPAPDPQASAGVQVYIASLQAAGVAAQAAASPIQQFVDDIRAQGAALGKTEEQINAHIAALSREALAAGDVTRALQLEEAALGIVGQEEQAGTAKSAARAAAEARAALAARDYAGAARILAADLQTQGERTNAVINAERQLIQIQNQAAAAAQKQAKEVQQAADAELRLAQVTARGQAAAGNKAGALQTLTQAQSQVVGASDRARASVDAQAASLEHSSTIAGQFKSQLLGIVGPAALVAGAFAAARGTVQSFAEAFKFKAELDETNASIKVLLTGVRDTSDVFEQARKFGDRYKLTQKETSEAIADSIPVIRASKSSIDDILSVFTRLTILKPGKTFNDASRAISELQSGNAVSLERIFNVPLDKANKLKEEIKGGADAVQVLSKFLTESGVGASALEVRTQGVAGAMRDAAIAAERLQLAQAKFAQGPGVAITKAQAAALDTLTADLSGQGDLAAANRAFLAALAKTGDVSEAFDARARVLNVTLGEQAGIFDEERSALGRLQIAADAAKDAEQRRVNVLNAAQVAGAAAADTFRTQAKEIDASAEKSALDAAAKDAQQAKTALVALRTKDAAAAFLSLNPALDQAGVLALLAAGHLDPLLGQLLLLKFRAQEARAALTDEKLQSQTARQLTGADSDEAGIREGKHAGVVRGRAEGQAAAAATAEARRQADAAAGNLAPALTRAQAELNQLAKDGKQNTAEYIQKQQQVADLQQKQAAQGRKTLDDQIAYAKATGDSATARKLLNQELADAKATGNIGEQARILNEIEALDKKGRSGASKGISALDQDSIQAGETLQAQLDAVNKLLEKGNLSAHQHNDLLEKRRKLEEQITDENIKQNRAALDAQIGINDDAIKRLQEARELAGLEAEIKSSHFSDAEKRSAELERNKILLDQQKRALDIQKDQKAAGAAVVDTTQQQAAATQQAATAQRSAITPQVPIPNVAQLAPTQPPALNLSLTIQLDPVTGIATVVNPPAGVSVGIIEILNKAAVKG